MQSTSDKIGTDAAVGTLNALFRAQTDLSGDLPPATAQLFKEVLERAGLQGVAPALAKGIRDLPEMEAEWKGMLPFFAAIETENVSRNEKLLVAANRLAALLEAHGINPVFLKGTAFIIEQAPAAWREVGDIDVLLPHSRVAEAADILLHVGFRQTEDIVGYSEGLHHHLPAFFDDAGIMVELHSRLAVHQNDCPISATEIFASARPVANTHVPLLIPCPEHRLIHLVVHAQVSNWGLALRQISLRDMLDIHELASKHTIDWRAVRLAFERIGAEKQLFGFLCASHILLGLPFPYSEEERNAGSDWAGEAINSLYVPHPRWKTAGRVLVYYVKTFARDPRRLRLIWDTVWHPARRKYLFNVMRGRFSSR